MPNLTLYLIFSFSGLFLRSIYVDCANSVTIHTMDLKLWHKKDLIWGKAVQWQKRDFGNFQGP